MQFCNQAGIPHSEFLSWEESDQEAAMEYELHSGERCPGCGTFPSDWLDEKGQHKEPQPFLAHTVNCLGCEALAEARDKIPDKQRSHIYVFLRVNEAAHRGYRRFGRR
jgi:hypothetical protein